MLHAGHLTTGNTNCQYYINNMLWLTISLDALSENTAHGHHRMVDGLGFASL